MGIRAREKKGYHCHIALIFNERKRTSAWSIAKAIGELWEDVTGNDGSYFNCHDRRYLKQYEEQDTLGVGIIYSEVDYQVRKMCSTLSYLARPEKEQYLRVKQRGRCVPLACHSVNWNHTQICTI